MTARLEGLPGPHPDEPDLLAYLDGELPSAQQDRIRLHLETCWTCRSSAHALQNAIGRFLEARHELCDAVPLERGLPGAARARLAARLERPVVSRWSPGSLLRPAGVALALVLFAALLFATFETPVSAGHVLKQADARELLTLTRADSVVVSTDQLERHGPGGAPHAIGGIELARDYVSHARIMSIRHAGGELSVQRFWTDAAVRRAPLPFRDVFGERLAAYFTDRGWFPSVSASRYIELIEADARGSDESWARRSGQLIEVGHPFAPAHPSGLRETRLVVDARTQLAVQVRLFVAGPDGPAEYRLVRSGLEFLPRTPAFAQSFAAARPEPRPSPPAPVVASRPPLRRPLPLSYFDSAGSTAELAAAVRVHAVDGCLGEEINIFPMSDGSVLVQGLVDTLERRRQIEQSVRNAPGAVRIEIYTPREIGDGRMLFAPPDQRHATDGTNLPGSVAPVRFAGIEATNMAAYDVLHRHFASREDPTDVHRLITNFAGDLLTLSREGWLHAWALRRLDVQFAPRRIAGFGDDARAELQRMRRDHRIALATVSRTAHERLRQLVPGELPGASAPHETEDLMRMVTTQMDLAGRLFTASGAAGSRGLESDIRELLHLFAATSMTAADR